MSDWMRPAEKKKMWKNGEKWSHINCIFARHVDVRRVHVRQRERECRDMRGVRFAAVVAFVAFVFDDCVVIIFRITRTTTRCGHRQIEFDNAARRAATTAATVAGETAAWGLARLARVAASAAREDW